MYNPSEFVSIDEDQEELDRYEYYQEHPELLTVSSNIVSIEEDDVLF